MKTATSFLILAFGVMEYVEGFELSKDEPISINLKLIATADGKSYFADRTVNRNWTEAKQYCEEYGMKLADITSKAQADALSASYLPSDFDGAYWTSGRDAHQIQQFSWDTTDSGISTYTSFVIRQNVPYQTCVFYWSNYVATNHHMSYLPCSSLEGTLCQT